MKNDILCHHGIKGQRWGVRRFQNKDGTLTTAGKRRYSATSFDEAYKLIGNKNRDDDYTTQEFIYSDKNKMRTDSILLPKDAEVTRVSTHSNEEKAKALYVNFINDLQEVDYYKKEWPYEVDSIEGKQHDWYQNTFKLKTQLLTPSLDRRKQAANAIINADEKLKIEMGKRLLLKTLSRNNWYVNDYIPKPYSNSVSGIKKYYKDFYNSASERKKTKEEQQFIKDEIQDAINNYDKRRKEKFDAISNDYDFKEFTSTLPTSKKLMKAYINELKKDGFDAVFDDNAGAKAAFIIFDAKNLKQTESQQFDVDYSHLTEEDLKLAPWIKNKK